MTNDQSRAIDDPHEAVDDAGTLVRRVLPRDTADAVCRLTGVPMRSVTRWLKGEARFPPTLRAKFERQALLKEAFVDELSRMFERHEKADLLPEVMRQAILTEVAGEFFKTKQEL